MIKCFVFILVTSMISFIPLGCDNGQGSDVTSTAHLPDVNDGETVTLTGTVKTGSDIGSEFCADVHYLEDEIGFLRVESATEQDEESVIQSVGKSVEIRGAYYGPSSCSEECFCDDFISIESITVLE